MLRQLLGGRVGIGQPDAGDRNFSGEVAPDLESKISGKYQIVIVLERWEKFRKNSVSDLVVCALASQLNGCGFSSNQSDFLFKQGTADLIFFRATVQSTKEKMGLRVEIL